MGLDDLRLRLRTEAHTEWGIRPRGAERVFVAAFVGSFALIASRVSKPLFVFLTAEDSLLEWAQFAGFAVAAGLAALIARSLTRRGYPGAALTYTTIAVGLVFVAGEEISWGQRLLGLRTPEALAEVNKQDEITLHNIGDILFLFNVGMLLVGLYGSLVTVWLRVRSSWRAHPLFDVFVPPLFLTSWFFVLFGYKAIRLVAIPESYFTVVEAGEWAELCLAFALPVWLGLVLLCDRLPGPPAATVAASREPLSRLRP